MVKGRVGRVKVLAEGGLTKPLVVRAHAFSQQAREKIMALGGSAEVI
jgi:large subunit ribosomal protein L15